MGERRLPAGACLLAVAMVLQAAAVVLVLGEESDGAGALLDPRQLEKFVDELPDMPRLRGYGVTEGGAIVAGNLTIGMYDTTWVMLLIRHRRLLVKSIWRCSLFLQLTHRLLLIWRCSQFGYWMSCL